MPSKRVSLLAAGLLLAAVTSTSAQTPAGTWRGVLALAAGEVEVVIDLEETADGWRGSAAAPALDLEGLELSDFDAGDGRIAFTIAGLGNGVRLTAEVDEDGDRLAGESAENPPATPPATDIFLFAVDDFEDWSPSPPVNLTDRDGYDNQPHFWPDGSAILYTSIRDGQADVYRYSLADGTTTRITDTPESEYSPTPMPGGYRFSTVRVEADGTQRLWSFDAAGAEPRLVLADVQPVGYHAWMGEGVLALFVLGDPHTLELADVATGEVRQVAASIGRSLHRVPGRSRLSFVHKPNDEEWRIEIFDPWMNRTLPVVETRPGSEDLAWTADQRILMGEGSKLFRHDAGAAANLGREPQGWVELADLESLGVRDITRLAVSPDGRHLAVVGSRRVPPLPAPEPRGFELERQ